MFITLTISAFLTSIISGVLGMGGGIVLLSVMTIFLNPTTLIPIHGVVQLVSNSARTFYLRKYIKKNFFFYYLLGLPIGAFISALLLRQYISDLGVYIALALVIMYSVFKPKKLPELKIKTKYWVIVGALTGILAILVGAVGPLLAVFFIRDDLSKEEIISTKSVMQLAAHLIKIPAFLFLEFDYIQHLNIIFPMCIAVIIGTKVGVSLLKKVDKNSFKFLFKGVLFLAGVRICFRIFEL